MRSDCPLCAKSRHSAFIRITSSARATSEGDTVRPKALALARLRHRRTFGPGDSVLMEDISGEGHRTQACPRLKCLKVHPPELTLSIKEAQLGRAAHPWRTAQARV